MPAAASTAAALGVAALPDEKHEEALPRYKRDLVAKMKILRAELQAMQPQSGHCRLEVSRAEIFEVRDVAHPWNTISELIGTGDQKE